eukprot:jgi/Ulvmu1/11476/UM077_0020.1
MPDCGSFFFGTARHRRALVWPGLRNKPIVTQTVADTTPCNDRYGTNAARPAIQSESWSASDAQGLGSKRYLPEPIEEIWCMYTVMKSGDLGERKWLQCRLKCAAPLR